MALIIKDRVKEITTTTGTGAVSLGGASATFDAFQSVMSNGDTTFYAIVHTASGTDEWEVGLGTWNTGNTLTRTTVYAGSNGTSAVNFSSGNKDIFMTYPASKAAVAGEDVTFADVTATNITATGTVTLAGDPTSALQAATKEYVDTIAAAGIHYHTPVRVEAPSALTATYDNGTSGVGATLTNSGTQAALVIDGVTLSTSDRVLVYNQTNAAHNGIYTVTNTGSASTNWVLTRATDADSYGASDPDALGEGDAYFVKEGDTGAGELYVMNTSGVITFGTTNITFTVIAETAVYSAGTGLTLTGTIFSTNQDISTSASPTFNNITVTGTVDGRDVATDGSKLDGIEAGATADQTAAEIKTAYESNSNTNAFTDAEKTKLSGIETGATGDQTASEILTAIKTVDGAASGLDADLLDGQQGSYYLNTGTTFSGDVSGTYNNIVVANDSHTHDGRYYTETEADSRFVNATGDTMSGQLVVDDGNANPLELKRSSQVGIEFNDTSVGSRYLGVNGGNLWFGSNLNHGVNQKVFTDAYHPNADKWTTARTLSLSGDASGSVSWDGSANATLSVTVADDSHAHSRLYEKSTVDYGASYLQWFDVSGTGGSNGNGNTPSNPTSDWYHHIIANHANSGGYYVDIAQAFHSDAVYHRRLENGSLRSWQRFFTDAYHPNADKWTTARTLTLSGDASGSVSWDGSANATLSVTVANDSHSHSNYITSNANDSFSGLVTSTNTTVGMSFNGALSWAVSSSDAAHQRADARDDATNYSRLHWYGVSDGGSTNYFRHAWYDGSAYINIDANASNINFTRTTGTANLQVHGNTVWHAGNDGSGSGLDADLLDGQHASAFAPAGGSYSTDWAADDLFYDAWIRNNGTSASGLYWHNSSNPGYAWHIYPENQQDMTFRTGSANGGIKGTIAGTVARGYVHWTTGNEIGFLNNSRSWSLRVDSSGNSYHTGSARAPVFYDSNDTSYYTNPNSTSSMYQIHVWNDVEFRNKGQAITGTYDSYALQGVFNMGDAYKLASDGSTAGNLYGIAWSHPNAGTKGGANNLASHGMLILENGAWKGAWGGGSLRTPTDIRAPIFYDYNNTSYYVNPESTSRLNSIEADGFHAADMGDWITFYGDNSGHHGITARDNAGTASDDLRINSYGSVYINLDSNNNNTSTADFKIGRHGGATGSISQLGLLQVFGDSLYVSTDYSFRAPIFYDINNTGYYIDGNSTSVLNQVQVNYLGVGTAPNTSYRINMNGGIDMNAGNIDYVNQLHFQDNVRFYDDGNNQYLNFKYGNISDGGIKIRDGNNDINGYVYSNGLGGFGLLDKDGHWFLFTNGTSETQLRANNNAELYVYTSYVYAPGSFRSHIFYDADNTAYYSNQAGTSVYNQINVTTLNTTSDKRFKSDLVKIDNAIDKVKAINGYTYILDGNDDRKGGLIAQEVEEVLPEAVKGDDYKKLLDYNATIALLVEAIKEQQQQIDALKKQLNS